MATKNGSVEKQVCPLFAESNPPVYAEDVGSVVIKKAIVDPATGRPQFTVVNFKAQKYRFKKKGAKS